MQFPTAPELMVSSWHNTPHPLALKDMRGKVVVIAAFQMLCPGCVSHGLPQATNITQIFSKDAVQVIGLHCVFEHHEVQGTQEALSAFIHEYRWPFPIALDEHAEGQRIPRTMEALALQGTPSLVLIDADGAIRHKHFGRPTDMLVGAQIMELVGMANAVRRSEPVAPNHDRSGAEDCAQGACSA